MNFVTIAIEKAKAPCNTIYSIGLVKYQDGKKVDAFYSLVKPPELCVQPNIAITHNRYTAEDLQNAPTIAELWLSKIYSFIGNFCLVSRIMGNDLDVLLINLEWFGLPIPVLKYFCFFRLGWKLWPSIEQHSHLPSFAEELGVEYKINNTLDEAEVYGKIILIAAEKLKSSDIDDLLRAANDELGVYEKIILMAAEKYKSSDIDVLLRAEKLQIEMIVKSSLNLWKNNLEKPLEEYDIKALEQLAVDLYEDCLLHRKNPEGVVGLLNDIVHERGTRLNDSFSWTEENVSKLLRANDLLVSAAEKAYAQAQSLIEKLKIKRDENNDLIGYEIEIKLTPYISGYADPESDAGASFMNIICEPLDNKYLLTCDADDNKYFDRSETWLEGLWDENLKILDCFKDKYISYAVHELWDAHWFFHDIMNIDRVHIEVKMEAEIGYEKYNFNN